MHPQFPELFKPFQIGKLKLKNRIAMAPMGFPALQDVTGLPTQRYVDYFVERARGGAGLLITGMLKVEEQVEYTTRKRGPVRDEFIRPFADMTEAVHSLGAKIFAQLSPGFGASARPGSVTGGPVAPSAVPNFGDPRITCRALKTEEVEELVQAYGRAAEIIAKAGVDGIELHGHAGFLLDQFTCAFWNKRDDRYGGDLRGRLTFPLEIIGEIRKRLGDDYPITYRYGLTHYTKSLQQAALPGEDYIEVGRTIEEGLDMAALLEEAGIHGLAIDAGTLAGHYWAHPPIYQKHGCMLHLSELVKRKVSVPVLAVGRLDEPELAERALCDGQADIITLGKALLADPYWPNKVLRGELEEIRPCIGCHQACTEMIHGREINSCTVNPTCGRERAMELTVALRPKRVVVVGGGAAGMEAARVAAIRGHKVRLFEREPVLGGHLRDASAPEDKRDINKLDLWMQHQLRQLGVDIRLGATVTPETLADEEADAIILATGSSDVRPSIPVAEGMPASTATEVLLGDAAPAGEVVVVGGGENGCEVALWLARKGQKVTIVEALGQLVSIPVARANRNMLIDLLNFQGITILTRTKVVAIERSHAVILGPEGQSKIPCDSVVFAVGMKSRAALRDAIQGSIPVPVYTIGDGDEPKNIMKAIWDGFEVGRTL